MSTDRPPGVRSAGAESAVLLDVSDGVAQVVLNRPAQGNTLDVDMAHRLGAVFSEIADDPAVRVVLLSGNGRFFCAGGDLAAMAAASDRAAFVHELAVAAHGAVQLLAALEKPVVAAVQGAAAGAGLSLVLLSDLVVASSTASFVTAYTSVGLTPDCGQSWLLPRAVGISRALDLTLTSPRLSAAQAHALGLVSRVVEPNSLTAEAEALARRLAQGPVSLGPARALIRDGYAEGFREHLAREAAAISRAAGAVETGALIEAFLAR